MPTTADLPFHNCRVLVVEDEYMLADDLCRELTDGGATVVGPVPSVERALALLAGSELLLDGAVLDVNLGGEFAYPVADALAERGVPFVFTTGYDASAIPSRYGSVDKCEKPLDLRAVARTVRRAIADAHR